MRRAVRLLPVLCTLLLVGLGAGMPRLAALALDRGLAREVSQREAPSVSLELLQDADFFHTLELFQRRTSQIQLSEGYRMTAEEAAQAAQAILADLGAGAPADAVPEAIPYLFSDADTQNTSGVFWRCAWDSGGKAEAQLLWLDDQTGMMVGFQGAFRGTVLDEKYAVFQEPATAVAEYCRLNYPVETVKLALESSDNYLAAYPESDAPAYILSLVRDEDGREVVLRLPLWTTGRWVNFNL